MENEKPRVSVIMPVYNAGEYLDKAIQSVLNQTYSNFELIIIDDGSTDGSGIKCDHYSELDSRVKVIHKINGGISSARNLGIKFASGRYIAFCDHDDEYCSDYLKTTVHYMETKDLDLLKFEYKSVRFIDGHQNESIIHGTPGIYNATEVSNNHDLLNQTLRAMWNGLYKKSIIDINVIEFDEYFKTGVEDYDFNIKYLSHCCRIGFIDELLFVHYIRENQSVDTFFSKNKVDSWKKMAAIEYNYLSEMRVFDPYVYIKAEYSYLSSLITALNSKNCNWNLKNKVDYLEEYWENDAFIKKLTKRTILKYFSRDLFKTPLLLFYSYKLFYVCLWFMYIKQTIWNFSHAKR